MKMRKLKNPPIVEAVIEIRFQPLLDLSEDDIELINSNIDKNYSEYEKINNNSVLFKVENNDIDQIENESEFYGAIFRNQNANFILQILKDKFVLSQVKQYKDFESLKIEFFKLLNIVNNLIELKTIKRVGLRYINEFTVDNGILKNDINLLEEYKSYKYQEAYNRYIYKIEEDISLILHIGVNNANHKRLIDIDCIYEPPNSVKIDQFVIESLLEKLRETKNNVFFEIFSNKNQ